MNHQSWRSHGALPRVFSLADLKRLLGDDEQVAMDTALRWLESGQVRQIAPPRPVFIRLGAGELPDERDLCLALRRTFPAVVIVGGSALWRQGASRERDLLLDCAVSGATDRCNLPGVRLHLRPDGWLAAVSRARGLAGNRHEVPLLSAEMAVADAAAFADVWVPDRSSLDWQRLSAERVAAAQKALQSIRV